MAILLKIAPPAPGKVLFQSPVVFLEMPGFIGTAKRDGIENRRYCSLPRVILLLEFIFEGVCAEIENRIKIVLQCQPEGAVK